MKNIVNRVVIILVLLFIVISVNAQKDDFDLSINNKIESNIISKQLDSAKFYISKQPSNPYLKTLDKISKGKADYADYYNFISNLGNRSDIDYIDISSYINLIIVPDHPDSLVYDYVKIKWLQISKLRDEVTIEEANKEQAKLENYIKKFDDKDVNVIKARLLADIHQIVLYQIQNDVENGKSLCLKSLEIAKQLKDDELVIAFLYHLCDFYMIEGKLDAYIETSEESLSIEKEINSKSSYYTGTIIHLVDAYVYKGGHNKRVEELLSEIYENQTTRIHSYSLYTKYLGTLPNNSPIQKTIFKQFQVSNILEFCNKVEALGKKQLNSNDFFHVLNESSKTLASLGFFKESLAFKDKCVLLTRKIYSEDLSQSLANFKTKQVIESKQLELNHEKEQSKLYIIISLLVSFLLIGALLFLNRKQKQSKILKSKNTQIKEALKEKELLIKEVHHRVKNNFQIVSSLLELQTHGINDEKALEFIVENQNRVKSMALIHQKLYQNKNDLIDFKDYVKDLINELSQLYVSNKKVKITTDIENIYFDIDTAIPLGLIVNELVTNAYKHAFIDEEVAGELSVSVKRNDKESYKLIVFDNGIGIRDYNTIGEIKKFGLHLVIRLVKQLQGELKLENDSGLNVLIVFKDIKARKNID